MKKIIIEHVNSEEITEWIFPQMEIPEPNEQSEEASELNDEEVKSEEEIAQEEFLLKQKMEALEIEKLKEELKNKIEIVNNIINKLNEPLTFVDEEVLDLMQSIIKKAVKNIILKEIKTDPKIINKMIADMKELIHEKEGMLTIYLSDVDFKRFTQDKSNKLTVKSDPNLKEADIIIKSNYAEIHSIFNERIDKMIGTKK